MKKLRNFLAAGLLFLAGCASVDKLDTYFFPREMSVSGKTYSINQNELKQESVNNGFRFGVVSDIHNEIEKAEKIAKEFGKDDLDGIIITGDMSRHFNDEKNVPGEKEIKDSLVPFLELGKPVYVIAGNHETRNGYFKVMGELAGQYNNLFDLATLKYADLTGVNIFGVSGGTYTPSGGFSVKKEVKEVDERVFSLDSDPVLMVSHMPAKFNHKGAVDCVYDVVVGRKVIKDRHKGEKAVYEQEGKRINPKNEGRKELTDLIEKGVDFSVSGHYHMNQGANNFYENISENKFSSQLFMTPGAAQYDMAGILTIKGNEARYELIDVGE